MISQTLLRAGREALVPVVVALAAFTGYSFTVNRTVSFLDNGELAAAGSLLGIPHPTGYPLFILLARLVSMVSPFEEITSLNFFAALLVSVSLAVFCALMVRIMTLAGLKKNLEFSAATGSLTLGFAATVWAQAVAIEVYALHFLLVVLFLTLFLKGVEETSRSGALARPLILAGFVLGLSFTNHMTTLFVLPACFFWFLACFGWKKETAALLAKLSPSFLLGLTPYLVLPIRSSSHPPLNWGFPAEWERFTWHISGKQYRSWIFSGFESAERQFAHFLDSVPANFLWPSVVVLALGGVVLMWRSRRMFWFVMALAIGCVAYAVNYDIPDIDAYFLLAYIAGGMLITVGVWKVSSLMRERIHPWAVPVLAVLPVISFLGNFPKVDESANDQVHNYVTEAFSRLDSNAVVLTYQWDYLVSPSYYFQLVKRVRPDVVMIDKELLRRSWYFIQLGQSAPWLLEKTRSSVDGFLQELAKFERGLPYHGPEIEKRFNGMINAMIDSAFSTRPVYVGAEMEPQFGSVYDRVPVGFLLRLVPKDTTIEIGDFKPEWRESGFKSRLTDGLKIQYAKYYTMRALWLLGKRQDPEGARLALERALLVDPTFIPARQLLGSLATARGRTP